MRRILGAALLLPVLFAGCQGLGLEREYSYKWGRVGPRFLEDFLRPAPLEALGPPGDYTNRDAEASKALEAAGRRAYGLGSITAVDEDIYLVVTDRDGVGFTVSIHNGDVDVREGLREGIKPSLVVPLTHQEALELPDLLGSRSQDAQGRLVDGVTAESLFRLVKLLLVPGLQALYSMDELYGPANRQSLGFDDFVQFELAAPTVGDLEPARITLLNVDGQWLFLRGWHGDPDLRIRLGVTQALEIYKTAIYDFKKAKSPTDKALLSSKYADLRRSAVVYTRPDHK